MKVLRIALDANEANVKNRVGSNIYAYKLLLELERLTRISQEFNFVVYLAAPPQKDFPAARTGWEYRVLTPKPLWTQWRFPLELMLHASEYDLVLSLGHYAPRFSSVPSAICILDLAFLKFPQFFRRRDLAQLTAWTAYSARKAKHIFTISQSSELDIIKEYGRGPEEISIVYPGVELPQGRVDITHDARVLASFGLERQKYLVSVGTIQPRKNMINLIHAFEKIQEDQKTRRSDIKLVFVGKSGWLTSEFEEAVAISPVKDKIVVTGFVDEGTKYALLRQAQASLLVGFYEGFGIPAIESMGVGVRPVAASTGSLPEVVGNLGILVDPYSVSDIARGLSQAAKETPSPEEKEKMKARSAQFTWEKSGSEMLNVLCKLKIDN